MKYIKAQPNPQGRLGHQFQNMSLGIVLSQLSNTEYIHTPFTGRSSHWEDVFNFSKAYVPITAKNGFVSQINLPPINLGSDYRYDAKLAKKNVGIWLEIIKNGPDNALYLTPFDAFPGILGENIFNESDTLKKCYWSDKSKFKFDKNFTNVGVHIRRGDISKQGNANRWLELNNYNKLMNCLRKENDTIDKPYKFHIFSEGPSKAFSELKNNDVAFQLNGSDIEAFRMLSSVDLLVTGLSTFSILSAYISDCPVLYHKLGNYTRWENIPRFTDIKNIQ